MITEKPSKREAGTGTGCQLNTTMHNRNYGGIDYLPNYVVFIEEPVLNRKIVTLNP